MSEFISLAELKGMSSGDLASRWVRGLFPFEMIPECHACVTMHGRPQSEGPHCDLSKHEGLRTAISLEMPWLTMKEELTPYLESIYSLRLFYQHLYADNPPEIMDLPAEGESTCEIGQRNFTSHELNSTATTMVK